MSGFLSPLLSFALMVTNEAPAIVAPTNAAVGWQHVANNGPFTAIGPRLTCSVQHVGVFEPTFDGDPNPYHIREVIEPPGSDVRFMVLDRDIISGYAKLATNFVNGQNVALWLVGAGDGTGQIDNGVTYHWGGAPTQKKRWGWSGAAWIMVGGCYYSFRFDNGATASGDSGYGAFLQTGEYVGPFSGGSNPSTLGQYQSSGELACCYLEWIRDYLPVQTNGPPHLKPPGPLTITVVRDAP